jgi:murein DD-endopeptidase MepM/ murein hydrolase activator NlpD
MLTSMLQLPKRLFAERHVVIRSSGRIRYLTLSRRSQILALGVLLVGASVAARMTASYFVVDRKMAHKQAEVELAQFSADDLRDLVMHLEGRLAIAGRELEETRGQLASAMIQNATMRADIRAAEARLRVLDETQATLLAQRAEAQNRLRGAEEALNAKSGQVTRMNRSLDSAKSDLKATEEQRTALVKRIKDLEDEVQAATIRAAQFKATADQVQSKLQQIAAEREKALAERDGLLGRVAVMQQARVRAEARVHDEGKPGGKANAAAPVAVDADDRLLTVADSEPVQLADAEPPVTSGRVGGDDLKAVGSVGGELWRLLSSVGVDLDQLASHFGAARPGQGGPFIGLKGLKATGSAHGGDAIPEELKRALKSLPLAAPLTHYQVESRFGVRRDPFNRRSAMHTGVDFSAPFKSPVYSTASGTVIFAGVNGEFGKVVDIDHGSGIVTRYAHLHRIAVVKGQRVVGREQIGLLGSSGRSTGPHVHYEVQVNGVPQDPEKFLQAGNIVQTSGKQPVQP